MATIGAAGMSETVRVLAATIIENGAGTYDADFIIPQGATILDIQVDGEALWAAATSASLEIGDASDPDGFFTAVDLKATDLLAGEAISFAKGGGVEGANFEVAATHNAKGLRDTTQERTLRARVVSVGAGATGRTTIRVLYAMVGVREITQ